MTIIDILLLSAALAMDCFAISIVSGVIMGKPQWRSILTMALLFGFFQAFMPLIGWTGTSLFAVYIEKFDHWIAFALLAFIGIKMIRDAFSGNETEHFNPARLATQLVLAVATSIDALAVGISFACTDYSTLHALLLPLTLIGVTSFVFSVGGSLLGLRYGTNIAKRLKPELLGGIILLIIAFKVLLEHLLD